MLISSINVLCSSPLYVPVDGANIGNMNWAVVIVGAEMLFSGAYWIYGARHKYMKAPPVISDAQIQIIEGEAPRNVNQVDGEETLKKV